MSESLSGLCTCAGPMVNTHVDGNEGHNPFCPAHPRNRPAAEHAPYLDDDGVEGVQFVRHDLASNENEVIGSLTREGLYDDAFVYEIDVVWMRPIDTDDAFAEDYYDVVTEALGVVRYWRLVPGAEVGIEVPARPTGEST